MRNVERCWNTKKCQRYNNAVVHHLYWHLSILGILHNDSCCPLSRFSDGLLCKNIPRGNVVSLRPETELFLFTTSSKITQSSRYHQQSLRLLSQLISRRWLMGTNEKIQSLPSQHVYSWARSVSGKFFWKPTHVASVKIYLLTFPAGCHLYVTLRNYPTQSITDSSNFN